MILLEQGYSESYRTIELSGKLLRLLKSRVVVHLMLISIIVLGLIKWLVNLILLKKCVLLTITP